MKTHKILYWLPTLLITGWMLFQAFNFVFNFELTAEFFATLYVSPMLIFPLATAKFLAVLAILVEKSRILKQLAYNGLYTDFSFATLVHLNAGDGGWPAPVAAIILLTLSLIFWKRSERIEAAKI